MKENKRLKTTVADKDKIIKGAEKTIEAYSNRISELEKELNDNKEKNVGMVASTFTLLNPTT